MVNRSFLALAFALLLQGCTHHDLSSKELEATNNDDLKVHNLADDFVEFFDDTKDLPLSERREVFKASIATEFSDFYNIERFSDPSQSPEQLQTWYDERVENAIIEFPSIRDRYIAKVEKFGRNLDAYTQSFKNQFPGLDINHEIYFVHSLGEMDGGTRDFYGRYYLVFGADGMVEYHDFPDYTREGPFFHHELFHVYHNDVFNNCHGLWCSIWREGLATYVAKSLNPSATNSELLLNSPFGMAKAVEENLLANLRDLKFRIDYPQDGDYRALISQNADPSDLPTRRGYYLGYLIAQEIGQSYPLEDIARMSADQVEPLFNQALNTLIDRHDLD